jgi:hypothetical protein
MMTTLGGFSDKLAARETELAAMKTELAAAITTMPVPSAAAAPVAQ